MMSFHSKKRNFIQQEIYAAILLHCLTNMRLWLIKLIGTEELMKEKKYLAPIRQDRKYQRNMKPKSAIPFNTKAS